MQTTAAKAGVVRGGSVSALLPIMGAVFVAFLVIGLAMPVLPLHVHQGLGLGTFIVGLVGAPAESRGLAMGAYTAFLDVALAGASPLLGLVAAASDIGTVFLVGALSVVCAAPIALRLMK